MIDEDTAITLTEHPRVPGLPLHAGQMLRLGEICVIDEDGSVYRTPPPFRLVDGVVMQSYEVGEPVTLYTSAAILLYRQSS